LKHLFLFVSFCFFVHFSKAQKSIISSSSITAIKSVDQNIFFVSDNGISGSELWLTDGTVQGTQMVKDIYPGYTGSNPAELTNFNGKLFFSANIPSQANGLWVSDGTREGTRMAIDVSTVSGSTSGSLPRLLTIFKDHLYFTAGSGVLYKSDGTTEGTVQIDKTNFGNVSQLVVVGDFLYYIFNGYDVKRTDGINTFSVPSPSGITSGTYFKSIHKAGDKLFSIWGSTYYQHIELHVLDATGWWTLLKTYDATLYGDQSILNFTDVDGKLFYNLRTNSSQSSADELWITNGTTAGTSILKSFPWSYYSSGSAMENFASYKGMLYFRSGESSKKALWRSDGTVAGTVKFHDVILTMPSYKLNPPVISGNSLYFCGRPEDYGDAELWITDGTTTGTKVFANLNPATSSTPYLLADAQGVLYFVTQDQQFSFTLWSTTAAPEINVSKPFNTPVLSGGILTLDATAVGSCSKKEITIENAGRKELMLSSIEVTGNDFLLQGTLPEMLEPGKKAIVAITFNPQSTGTKAGQLIVSSNDSNEGDYKIILQAETTVAAVGNCETLTSGFVKIISPVASTRTIVLTKNAIEESTAVGSAVSTLQIPTATSSVSFALVSGQGDDDNSAFVVDGNTLKSVGLFNYSSKNVYTIRIKGTQGTNSTEEFFLIRIVKKPIAETIDACRPLSERLTYTITDIQFNSQGQLFAVTDDGRILQSIDEGDTWQPVNSGTNSPLSKIFFINKTGYISGTNVLLKSEDDGLSWFQLFVPSAQDYYFNNYVAFFVNEQTGFIGTSGGEFFSTTDGGKTITRKFGSSYSSDSFSALWFWDANAGIATRAGRDIVKTSDGGKTWQNINISSVGYFSGMTSMYFLNKNDGFVTTYSGLLRTRNGGSTWTKVTNSYSYAPTIIEFITDKVGFMSDFMTTDGGESWIMSSSYGLGTPTGFAFNNSTGKYFVSSRGYYSGGRAISVSSNQGASWQDLSRFYPERFLGLEFPSRKTGFLFGEYGNYKTTDSGITWKTLNWQVKIGDGWFFDEDNGLLSDGNVIYKTDNGGETIVEVLRGSQDTNNYSQPGNIYAFSPNLVFAYSWYSLYRSINGGSDWELVSSEDKYTQSMFFISAAIGYRMDLFGSVEKTTDSGQTWNSIFERDGNSSMVYNAIQFLDESTGFKAGNAFATTTDGGVTWTNIASNLGSEIIALHFLDTKHGICASRRGYQYETFDGGISWSQSYLSSEEIYDLKFRNNEMYFCGDQGNLGKIVATEFDPVQPGYITGRALVCKNDVELYTLPTSTTATYQWAISGGAILNDRGATAKITFPAAGQYQLMATLLNGCSTGKSRTLVIDVLQDVIPVISGETNVPAGSARKYEINSAANTTYLWSVSGAKNFVKESPGLITVNWAQTPGSAAVKVFAMENISGCRYQNALAVNIDLTLVDLTLGIENLLSNYITLYPNPVENQLHVVSSLSEECRIVLTDLMGRELLQHELEPGMETSISLGHLPPGIYLAVFSDKQGERRAVQRVIRN
jgi:ELWxxDGT repeat protein